MIIAKIFISGLPGSGKTTLLRRFQGNDNILTLDLDEIGKWSEEDKPVFLTDLDSLQTKMGEFEAIQEQNRDQHYMFIVAGYSDNILAVSKSLKSWEYVDMWLHASEKTLVKRLTERANNADANNWWNIFKGKPESIQAMKHTIDPETVMSDIEKEGILSYNNMVKIIDSLKDEMEAKPEGYQPEEDDDEENPTHQGEYSTATEFGFPSVNTMYFISATRMIVVFDLVQTKTYCYWTVQGDEDHRIISSAKGPFDTSLTMEADGTIWADTRVSESYFLEQSGHTAGSLKELYGQYATAWMKNQNRLFITKTKAQ